MKLYTLLFTICFTIPNFVVSKNNFCQEKCEDDLKLTSMEGNKNKIITLKNDNLVSIRGPIVEKSIDMFVNKLLKIPTNDVFIYLNSPGGIVTEGMRFIQVMKSLEQSGKTINCIVDKGASMAFVIFQNCQNRYIIDGSFLMQHQIKGGIQGEIENVKSRMKLFENIYMVMNKQQSERLKLSLKDFLQKVISDWWLYDDEILEEKAADEKVKILCHQDLLKKKNILEYDSFLGTIKLTFSACPLINEPTKIELQNVDDITFINVNNVTTKNIIKNEFLNFNKNNGYNYNL